MDVQDRPDSERTRKTLRSTAPRGRSRQNDKPLRGSSQIFHDEAHWPPSIAVLFLEMLNDAEEHEQNQYP
jgi:hypothetical protein